MQLPSHDLAAPRALVSIAFAASLAASAVAQVGTNYCTSAPSSTGAAAMIAGWGSTSVSLNDLRLSSSSLPQHTAAFFLCSRAQGLVLNPGGSTGHLCLGAPVGRVVGGVIANSGATGVVTVAADVNAMPQPGGAVVVRAGETWNFQCWYRDVLTGGGATSNFSDALEVLFTDGPGGPFLGLVPIPAGTFSMGSNAPGGAPYFGGSFGSDVHAVTISYAFWMGRHEVTQAEYRALMGVNPSPSQGDSKPVELVTWHQARAYCAALNVQQAGLVPAGYEFRLPTEAEWEYACRAGSTAEFHYGPSLFCDQARFWHSHHSNSACGVTVTNGVVSVGSYAPNAFGLHDMHGNVSEWCLDSYEPYGSQAVTDPFVTGGAQRVFRGGSWGGASSDCRSARRGRLDPSHGNHGLGIRVVLAPALVP